ncbi:hypothetical protein EW146_g9590 [Bondarzewia mesenterica]|uniref:DNA 3'-5' helicase n=1 Tax=Bondarzewia mesenterica TaxID=1095465 RepID=A0A4S4L5G0_9AGAM|nr:hypothetical protein EW146_g9590 [Bondarzewia mesenterica]
MSQTRNNLDALQRRMVVKNASSSSPQSSSAQSTTNKHTRFKPAKSNPLSSGPSSTRKTAPVTALPSFSTPGFGRTKPVSSHAAPLHSVPSADFIDISSSADSPPTSPSRYRSKRTSTDAAFPPPPVSPKRQKTFNTSNKENMFKAELKGKGKERYAPSPVAASGGQAQPTASHNEVSGITVTVRHHDHADLDSMSDDQIRTMYKSNYERVERVRRDRLDYNLDINKEQDIFVLEATIQLIDDRMSAIQSVIAARKNPHSVHSDASASTSCSSTRTVVDDTTQSSFIPERDASTGPCPDRTVEKSKYFFEAPAAQDRYVPVAPDDTEVEQEEVQTVETDDEKLWDSLHDRWSAIADDAPVPARASASTPAPSAPQSFTAPAFAPALLQSQPGPSSLAASDAFPVSDLSSNPCHGEVMEILKRDFHLRSFRKNQLEAILATLAGRDVFCGRTQGVTFVVSPLIALMMDQSQELQDKGVDVEMFTGEMSPEDRNRMRLRLTDRGPKPRIVYVTPEKLDANNIMKSLLAKLYRENQLARFVIDEAHLVTTWGRDFRESYAQLASLRREYPNVPIMALTASATPAVQSDVVNQLGLKDPVFLTQSFNRANLRYTVLGKPNNLTKAIIQYIKSNHSGHSGVIYCNGRDKCERVAAELVNQNIKARHFHAKMAETDKKLILKEWKDGRTDVIVGTIAFGMGINHASVRFVIHYDCPSSLIGYYQETGRAGRDGQPADCILYYSWSDCQSLLNRIRENEDLKTEDKERQVMDVREVIQFSLNDVDCRRVLLLSHFEEKFDPHQCEDTCDNCASTVPVVEQDVTGAAINLIKLIQEVETSRSKITRTQAIDVFRGSTKKDLMTKNLNRFRSYGAGKDVPQAQTERIFDHLASLQVFGSFQESNNGGYPVTYAGLGPMHRDFLYNGGTLLMKFRVQSKSVRKPSSRAAPRLKRKGPHQDLPEDPIDLYVDNEDDPNVTACYEDLKALRSEITNTEHLDSEEDVLTDGTLQTLSFTLPSDHPGFMKALDGPDADDAKAKWTIYGRQFLPICIKHHMRRPAAENSSNLSTAHPPPAQFRSEDLHQRFGYQAGASSKPLSTFVQLSSVYTGMGNLISRIALGLRLLSELEADYRAVEARLKRSPGLPVPNPTTSFWTIPPAHIATHRPDALPAYADVVIIGSGITGTSVARTLFEYDGRDLVDRQVDDAEKASMGQGGLSVVMLEARETCSGATGRNGGHINPPLFHDFSELKSRYGLDTARRIIRFRLAHLPELIRVAEEEGARTESQIREVESLDVYYRTDTFEEGVKALNAWKEDMPEESREVYALEGEEARQKFGLAPQTVGCIVTPAGAVHPYRFVTAVLSNLLKRHPTNFHLSTQTPCTRIDAPVIPEIHYTVHTPRGPIRARHVVHATNGWTPHLLAPLRMKVLPIRGLMSAQRPGQSLSASSTHHGARSHIFYDGPMGYDYLTQLPNGEHELMFGGGAAQGGKLIMADVGNADDSGYNMGIASHVAGALPEYFGADHWGAEGTPAEEDGVRWNSGRVKALWTGVLGISVDGLPWVGCVPDKVSGRTAPVSRDEGPSNVLPGEWIAAGYSGEGMVNAWMCGRALGCMLLGPEAEAAAHLGEWFPDAMRVTEKRWRKASLEDFARKL